MGAKTGIEWTDHTFNPWLGCQKVSPACTNCYAEVNRAVSAAAGRVGFPLWGPDSVRVKTSESYWKQPLRWNREAVAAGVRRRVFCASLADVFEDRRELDAHRAELLRLVYNTPNLDWLLLTKRPEKIAELVARAFDLDKRMEWLPAWLSGNAPRNVWLGTTVENHEQAEKRIPELLKIPARVRFLSCEPLLGPVDLEPWLRTVYHSNDDDPTRTGLHWIIAGGESGRDARPMHPEWARSLRDQCSSALIPYFFKQWGEFGTTEQLPGHMVRDIDAVHNLAGNPTEFWRVGKKAAGSLLDGLEHKAFPEVSRG